MKSTILVVGLAMVSVLISGCTTSEVLESDQEVMEKEESVMEKKENQMAGKESYTGKLLAGTTTEYREFTQADYEKAQQEGKTIVLYFYANWCPLCKAEQKDTFAAFNEINYPNMIGFRVNYKDSDTDADEEALAKEFGIAYQHTKVIIKNGERVLKAPDTWDKARYLEEMKKVA